MRESLKDYSSYIEGWRARSQRERVENEKRRMQAVQDAKRIAVFLGKFKGVSKVVGIGSAFDPDRFHSRSDIDLVVMGMPPSTFFLAHGRSMMITGFELDLISYENSSTLFKQRVDEEGVQLWP